MSTYQISPLDAFYTINRSLTTSLSNLSLRNYQYTVDNILTRLNHLNRFPQIISLFPYFIVFSFLNLMHSRSKEYAVSEC